MKLFVTSFPKKLFNKYLSCSVSRSDDRQLINNSFSSTASSESSISSRGNNNQNQNQKHHASLATPSPTSVLPTTTVDNISNNEISAVELSEISAGFYFEMEQAFKLIDGDGDGKITREELSELLRRVGNEPPSQEELNLLLAEVDRDGDGCISLEEFGAISSAFGPPAGDSDLKDAFDFFDTDHDGKITAKELLNVFKMIGDGQCTLEDCRRMISEVDKNENGFVCFEDFAIMMELQR